MLIVIESVFQTELTLKPLYVPSGYARVILALISFYFMPHNHVIACFCYVFSALLDAFDGHAARIFNQSTIQLM